MDYLERKNMQSKVIRNRKQKTMNSLFVALIVGISSLSAQDAKDEIKRLLDAQVVAWNTGDIDGFMQGYWNSDSTVFNSGGTLTRGWKNVLGRYKTSYATREKMGRLEFSDLVIRSLSSNAAVAMGVWKLYREKDEPWGRFTLIIEKKPEGWRITHDHTSSAN